MVFKKEHTPWNKGLTKETDIRVKTYSEKNSKTRKKLFDDGILKSNRKINFTKKQENKIGYLYCNVLMSTLDISKIFNCSVPPIREVLIKNNACMDLSTRRKKLFLGGKLKSTRKIEISHDTERKIINSYNKELLRMEAIGEILHLNHKVICRVLKDNGINTSVSYRKKLLISSGKMDVTKNLGDYVVVGKMVGDKSPNYGIIRTEETRKKLSLSKKGKTSIKQAEALRKSYASGKITPHNKGKTKDNYLPLMKVSEKTKGIKNYMFGRTGENCHLWKGGISFEPYGLEFNKKLKIRIRKRDNYICMMCNIHSEKLPRALDVHHTNYDKTCNLPPNLISLCKNCHSKTNFNRISWTKFFQSLLSEKYGYKYSEEGEIILEIKE